MASLRRSAESVNRVRHGDVVIQMGRYGEVCLGMFQLQERWRGGCASFVSHISCTRSLYRLSYVFYVFYAFHLFLRTRGYSGCTGAIMYRTPGSIRLFHLHPPYPLNGASGSIGFVLHAVPLKLMSVLSRGRLVKQYKIIASSSIHGMMV